MEALLLYQNLTSFPRSTKSSSIASSLLSHVLPSLFQWHIVILSLFLLLLDPSLCVFLYLFLSISWPIMPEINWNSFNASFINKMLFCSFPFWVPELEMFHECRIGFMFSGAQEMFIEHLLDRWITHVFPYLSCHYSYWMLQDTWSHWNSQTVLIKLALDQGAEVETSWQELAIENTNEPGILIDTQEGVGSDLEIFGLGWIESCFSCCVCSQKGRSTGCFLASLI